MDGRGRQLWQLTQPVNPNLIKKPPKGKFGSYVSHDDIEQLALSICGAHSFDVVEAIRGYVPAWQSKDGTKGLPERPDGVVGCLARLTVEIDGRTVTITEVGTADHPEDELDGENLKKAASDAYKRCWMRTGLALALWVTQGQNPSPYFVHDRLTKELTEEARRDDKVDTPSLFPDAEEAGA